VKTCFHQIVHLLAYAGIFVLLAGSGLFAQTETNPIPAMNPGFVKTNGDFVIIGNMMIKTNSPSNTDELKQYRWRVELLNRVMNSSMSNATEQGVEGARALIKDYPTRPNGYEFIMEAIEVYEYEGQPAKALALANELNAGSAPERFKLWAQGCLNRLDASGKPIAMQFTALDGREVDLSKMKGQVVLVDFWATTCGPCVAELPRVKAAYDSFHKQGFEVIGISCDTDKDQLTRFIREKGLPWPQYFDGQQQEKNKFAQGFGIDGIPHLFLVDKKGCLRFDNVQARDGFHGRGDTTTFEQKISSLLAEP
jgi:peroxiredoxin